MNPDQQPLRTSRTPRAVQIVAAARDLLEERGRDELTMRALAERLGIRAPSLYKHFRNKEAVEAALVEDALADMGTALHTALAGASPTDRVPVLLAAYRRHALAHPALYRLATTGPLPRAALPERLEEWAGSPFFLATEDPHLAQALWSYAHGMVVLELDDRFPGGSDLDLTWQAGARAFTEP
ncbi:TetR family transcriptional regulator [Streptomyces mashuensis]|uniref:TetR family transcriptional regulator n=1 Tax=Streptomyces mashuensis TaxID=33904 RepID=A0A919B219_9ACTN|nr:TetR/AcrR family transcriptional regulator [Streptomyces mashuensis]GHF42161.1 TetR family transcriptional regulator [Streptomyces mashuensis]